MKTISFAKKMSATLLAMVFSVTAAVANTGDTTITGDNAAVSYLQIADGQIYFNVKFENTDGGRFHVLVNDAEGDNLYHAAFTDKSFNKVFRAPVENGKLTVIIRDAKDKLNHKFELSTGSKLVQQIYVTKL